MSSKHDYDLIQQTLPLLISQPNNLVKHEIISIIQCINKCDEVILQFAEKEKSFFAPFVALSGHCVISNAQQIPKSLLSSASSACNVILQYILHEITEFEEKSILSKHQLIGIVQGLCDDIPPLLKSDIVALSALIKSTPLPDTLVYRKADKTASDLKTLSIASLRDDTTPKEPKRIRLDHSCEAIIEQLMTPIMESSKRDSHIENDKNIISPVGFASQSHDTKGLLIGKNLFNLQQLCGANVLLDFIMSLSTIKPYIQLVLATEEGAPLKLPTAGSDALSILKTCKLLIKDYDIIWRILSLPILEPLTEERLSKVITVIHACLYVSLTLTCSHTLTTTGVAAPVVKGATAAPLKDEDNENVISEIVDTSLEIYKRIMLVMKSSIRVGGQVCQNVHMFASWLLLSGIKFIMKCSSTTALNIPTLKDQGIKRQGYNTLCISLAGHAVQLLGSLFDDLKSEISLGSYNRLSSAEKLTSHHSSSSFKYNKFGYYSAFQRIEMLMSNINVTNLLFTLSSASYRKAGLLKAISRSASIEQNDKNLSPSATNSNDLDDESCYSSDESSRDEDSEPILGHLFREYDESQVSEKLMKSRQTLEMNYCNDKREPHRHLALSTSIFELLNTYFVCSEIESLRHYFKQTISEPQICILAHIIKDLDRESVHNFAFYAEFSLALTSFMHNLIATDVLNESLQNSLLSSLGVSPDPAQEGVWPLFVAPKTLSVLSQIILLKQQKEKDDLRFDTNAPSIQIWRGLLNHLKRLIQTDEIKDYELEDLNVEHSQLLLFLFHNLKLLQRKQVLLLVSQAIVDVSGSVGQLMIDHQIHCLGRLTHFFEYMIKNLYDAPSSLVEQIDTNLFKSLTTSAHKDNNVDENNKLYFHCREIDENYHQFTENKIFAASMRPRFYYLLNAEAFNSKDMPKPDGMALNFLLVGLQENLTYDTLYDALLTLLNVGTQYDFNYRHLDPDLRLSNLGLCAVQYTFNSVWRIVLQLPPSVQSLHLLSVGDVRQFDNPKALHYCLWISRLVNSKMLSTWVKDCLTKLLQNDPNLKPEQLLKSVTKTSNCIEFNVQLLKQLMGKQFSSVKCNATSNEIIGMEGMPLLFDTFTLDVLCAKTNVSLDSCYNLNDSSTTIATNLSVYGSNTESKQASVELLPSVLNLISCHLSCARSSIIHQMTNEDALQGIQTVPKLLNAFNSIIKMTSSKCNSKLIQLTQQLASHLPRNLMKTLVKWNAIAIDVQHWRNEYNSSPIPSESYIMAIESQHFNTLSASMSTPFNSAVNLKHFINTLLKFSEDLYQWSENKYSEDFIRVMLSLQLDSICESYASYGLTQLDTTFGSKESDAFVSALYVEALTHSYDLLINYSNKECCVEEKILIECMKFMESLLDTSAGQSALEKFFCEDDNKDIVQLLMSASNDSLSPAYSTRVLKFFSKLFQQTDKNPETISLVRLCTSLSKLSLLSRPDNTILQVWLSKVLCERQDGDPTVVVANQENRQLLQSLTSYIVKDTSAVDEEVASAFLLALIPMGSQILSSTSEVLGFSELMQIMTTLAGAGTGVGHLELTKAVINWLDTCKRYLSQKDVIEKLEKNINTGRHQMIMESTCHMLSYLADIYDALELLTDSTTGRPSSPDGDTMGVMDDDWIDEIPCPDEDESLAEDSDEESLCNKLCTFTTTQKEYMNQHWYNCHTCKMIEGVGVCTTCAKVCHKDHDVTYAKYGSFFCDCGAKEDGSCVALTRRPANIETNYTSRDNYPMETTLPSSLRRPSSPSMDKSAQSSDKKESTSRQKHEALTKQLENSKTDILSVLSNMNLSSTVLSLLQYLSPTMIKSCLRNSSIGCSVRAKEALKELHSIDKSIETSDQLMVPTLGSQEGAFENVRMTFTGEQGQQIRQLIQQQVVRRVAMCALASHHGKRQHLAVSHEKGKITLLQLATLLKQADSSKKKLTLTRLASAPLPFTAISIAGNPCNEDYLAVCGLKDCHVLTFSQTGVVSGHLVLHPQLEAGNYVIKAVWLPGSQTELAVVTADFIKIFDLGQDILSPQYFFLLPSGKIRDITFVFTEDGQRYVLIISSAGHIYCQIMSEESGAQNGQFYVTSILDIRHEEIVDTNGNINGGGVSIYYSHSFQLLFFSYTQGKNYCAPLPTLTANQEITYLFPIEIISASNGSASSNGSSTKSSVSTMQSLCQWTEVSGHPGLILAMSLNSNNPIVLMVKPDSIVVQEIKLNGKSKITDMVAMRHSTQNGDMRTTLILLCEDGSLRIYMASQEATNYWLRPVLHSSSKPFLSLSSKSKRSKKSSKILRNNSSNGFPQFAVDFFEHCSQISDIEFGGGDVLQIYNTHQVKNRLNTNGMYIASTKPNGFSIEVYNNDATTVMVGVRVNLATQDVIRAPTAIEIFGRSIPVALTRNRWYDIPFTREESLTADKKMTIFFAVSGDPNGITIVDSIKVYGKTKEAFVWPEDSEEYQQTVGVPAATVAPSSAVTVIDFDSQQSAQHFTSLDRLLTWSLDVLDGCFHLSTIPSDLKERQTQRESALEIGTQFLTLPYNGCVESNVKSLLATLHSSRAAYNSHRDQSVIEYVFRNIDTAVKSDELDGEAFFRWISMIKQIANERPQNLIKYSEAIEMTERTDTNGAKSIEMTTFSGENQFRSSSSMDMTSSDSFGYSEEMSASYDQNNSSAEKMSFCQYLNEIFWKLYALRPKNQLISSIARGGLIHVEETVQALVEIIHSFALTDAENNIQTASKLYLRLLLSEDTVISFCAKQSLIRVLRPRTRKRRVYIPSPPHCETPHEPKGGSTSSQSDPQLGAISAQGSLEVFVHDNQIERNEPLDQQFEVIEALDVQNDDNPQDLMVGANAGFPHLFHPDVDPDDEAMVELAIALSLQDQQQDVPQPPVPNVSVRRSGPQRSASLEDRGHYSDTTASAAASDDEGSTAATDGSTLRTSPANEILHANEGGSESGGSVVESIIGEHNVSGRSSAYGEDLGPPPVRVQPMISFESNLEPDITANQRLHNLRIALLEKMIVSLPEINDVGGLRSIPLMQVILMLTSDLDGEGEADKTVLNSLLTTLLAQLSQNTDDISKLIQRNPSNEVKLIIMRLLSILMSRVRTGSSSSKMPSSSTELLETSSAFCSTITAQTLMQSNILDFCLQILIQLLSYWKNYSTDESVNAITPTGTTTNTLLKAHSMFPPPEMSPFFLRQYVRGHADDVFESYPQLLTEMILRMPYQIKKIANALPSGQTPVQFAPCWVDYLCQYMMISLTPYIRKQVRKLLSYICGSKERYRQIRDLHALEAHMNDIKKLCRIGGFVEHSLQNGLINLSYDALISLIEHLKACSEIATNRTINWQKLCQKDSTLLPFLIQVSFLLDEGVSSIVLHLLQCALCAKSSNTSSSSTALSPSTRADDDLEEPLSTHLAQQLLKYVDNNLLSQFIQCFLLESNSSSHRWAAHSLIYNLYKSFSGHQQETLLDILWTLWPKLPAYGKKASQFVDLLGYFTLRVSCNAEKEREFAEKALTVLRQQNQHLFHHPNSNLYNTLQSLVEFDGYYLESEPCLVCNNPEVNYLNMKLSSIKVDSRFTTTTQIVKLIGSHTISKITLRISDIKRSKMVKTLNIFYNNRAVHSVVELKNKTALWHRARRCQLTAGQSELKIEFPLPIIACNLMIEYSDFYENIQASTETLQCPRCSATVAANPGVCSNCGENVFQCHKCRAINYDEKDPFLCNSCGFCKYAKFDYTLTAKPTCAVDPIENEEDRKKTVQSINGLLEKADRVYKSLISNKPSLEVLLLRIQEHGMIDKYDTDSVLLMAPTVGNGPPGAATIHVNRSIQQLALKYCQDCKTSFDELSKIIQKVLASRKELVDYDNKQKEKVVTPLMSSSRPNSRRDSKVLTSLSSSSGRCFGCASATVEHCITLLKALGMTPKYRSLLCSYGLLRELVDYNLRTGTINVRQEVRQLLCTLSRDNLRATADLNNLLMDKISVALKSRSGASIDLSSSVRHEIALLACSMEKEDSCWEQRLRCVMQLFLMGLQMDSPAVLESITLPCLRLLQSLIKPEPTVSKKNKDKTIEQLATVKTNGFQIGVDLNKWLAGDLRHSFRSWKQRTAKRSPTPQPLKEVSNETKTRAEIRSQYLCEKYGMRWKEKVLKSDKLVASLVRASWLRAILFNGASRSVRLMACSLIEALFQIPSRKKEIIDLLTSYLDDLGRAGEFANEFFSFYQTVVQTEHWKYYLALHGLLQQLGVLITKEIDVLNQLEETTLNSDLSQGCALKMLVELLQSMIDVSSIRRQYKSRMVGFVLNGYLSLRKLVVQRTKVIDETQEALLELLEEMTTGNESETAAFMAVCVEAVNKCQLHDMITPVFIFERLCSIIYPEENDSIEFFITLEKDPQQDDFLQGRMLGNPYSSNDSGMGPLMRDIKNRICQDCELVALLEDDSGLELLVNNKIISLDLPVKEVFRKIWQNDNNIDSDAMKIVYRIRGLMGDATEEFIESLDTKDNKEVNEEEIYKMANVMAECDGLQVMLQRLKVIEDLSPRSRLLAAVLLKLFGHCIRVKSNRQALIDPSLNAIGVMLNLLKLIITSESAELVTQPSAPGCPSCLEQLMQIMESILVEASQMAAKEFDLFCATTCGTSDDIKLLCSSPTSALIKGNFSLMTQIMRLIPFLTLGNGDKMSTLLSHFKPHLIFEKFDFDHTPDADHQLELFCMMSSGIESNANGARLKDLIIEDGIVASALEYLVLHAPTMKSSLLATSEEWKEFTSRPALKYVLRILTGLSHGHECTQLLVSKDSIPIIHGLEQVSSDAHVGSLAENLMEAIKEHPSVEAKIEEVRLKTRDEKKRLAMAVRERQLGALGMRTNDKGQVTAKASLLKQVEDLGEESGLICSICREGYSFQPSKVLGIYTYTKRCNFDDFEVKQRKSLGYTTVTHFNVVHVDCHMAAVRHARGRDEWESAALQNANTRCNGLLPLWGPQVQESAFASALARHNNYLQECTGHRDVSSTSYVSTIHDLKLLVIRFASEKSFSDDSGGGGPQSNLHMIPYMIHMALYVINTTRSAVREAKKVNAFLEMQTNKWIENCFEAESPYYWCTLSLIILAPSVWLKNRHKFLQRLILCAHVRHLSPQGANSLSDTTVQDFNVYKTSLIFWSFIDCLYNRMFKGVNCGDEWGMDWPLALAEYIRNNDQSLLDSGNKMLRFYEEDLIPCQSFAEFCDVVDLLSDIPDPNVYLENALKIPL